MYAKINGVNLFFEVAGLQYTVEGATIKEKPACLVFHGGPGCNHLYYLPELLALSETMQLIFIDNRGCGKSERCDLATCTLEQNAADGEALRKHLGLGKVFVYGASYGGMTAQRYAIDYPDNLYGVILESTAHNWPARAWETEVVNLRGTPEQKEMWARYSNGEEVTLDDFLRTMDSLYSYHYDADPVKVAQREALRKVEQEWDNPEVAAYQITHGLAEFETLPELKNVQCPVIIFAGKYDFITSYENSLEMHEVIPHSELHIFEDCSHSVWEDKPKEIKELVVEFVKKNFK